MSKNDFTMKQCHLIYTDGTQATMWVPENIAIKGANLKLQDNDTKEWMMANVLEVYASVQTWKVINERSQDYKKTRKASDI